ncbi:MAG: M20/M25/M40 family metallo-hydrolase [Candidatus Hodarchaeales archaeon]
MDSYTKEIISHIYASKDIMEPVYVLSDDIGPRPSGSEASVKAGQYIKQKFDSYGLETSIHEFKHTNWVAEETSFSIDGKEFPCVAFNSSGNGEITGEGFFLARPSKESFERANFDGKILFVEASHGMGMHRTEILNKAVEGGALAYVQVSKIPGGSVETGNITMMGIADIPALCISYEAGHYFNRAQKRGKGISTLIVKGRQEEVTGQNIIATQSGQSDKTIIVGAHYDTWSTGPGAYDNGTGVATLLKLAETIPKFIQEPNHNVKYIAFGAEELGFQGSMKFRKELVDTKKIDVPVMVNFDCTAWPKGVRTLSISNSMKLLGLVKNYLHPYNFDISINGRPPFGTDGFPFYLAKTPVISFEQIDRTNPTYMHTAFDTPDKLTTSSLKDSTIIAGSVLSKILQLDTW